MTPRHLVCASAALAASMLAGYAAVRGGVLLMAILVLPLGLGGALVVGLRPAFALVALTLAVPFYPDLFGKLLISGVPADLLAAARFWKELFVAGVILAALRRGIGHIDALDVIGGLFMVLLGAYFLLPGGADINTRLIAARQEGAFVLLFLACRRLDLPGPRVAHVLRAVVVVGLILSGFAIWNSFWPVPWAKWVSASGYLVYQHLDLGVTNSAIVWYGTLAGRPFVRAGSLVLSPLTLAYYLLIPLSLILAGADGLGRHRLLRIAALAGISAGLVLTLTRSAILLVPVLLLLLLVGSRARSRGALTAAFATAIVWPVATSVGLLDRLLTTLDPADPSGSAHLQILGQDLAALGQRPLGGGLATAGAASQRLAAGGITTESWYFQIGSDLGALGVFLMALLLLLTLVRLWRRSREGSQLATGALLALTAIALGGLVLQTLDDISVAWPVWILAGLATPAVAPAAASATVRIGRPRLREAPT